jgi:repressor LexA
MHATGGGVMPRKLTNKLTKRQQAIYDFVRELILSRGYGPTVREMATEFDIKSPNGVMCHLRALERKGLIRRDANKARAIELTRQPTTLSNDRDVRRRGLPFAGFVSAGFTDHAFELDERVDFDQMFKGQDLFVLRVKGDSMIEAHVADGDYVICRSCKTAEKGQMVVALNDDNEATLKFWHPERNRIRLQPANSSMSPIYVKRATVRGVVVGVVRSRL